MRLIDYKIKGEPIRINVVETEDDLPAFQTFIERNRRLLGWDTETTGLDWWNHDRDFRIRLAQFGNARESFVLPAERGQVYRNAARWALWAAERLVAHNGTFDQHVAEHTLGVPLEKLAPKSLDSKITGHLVDGRKVKEGGPGLALEDQVAFYIDREAAKEIKGSMTAIAKELKVKKEDVWPIVPLDHPDYLLYAGADPMWAYRLLHIHLNRIKAKTKASGLLSWEHRLSHSTARMERRGVLLDVPYAEARVAELKEEEDKWVKVANGLGVEKIGSGRQIAAVLLADGIKLTKKTLKSGEWSMTDDVLSAIEHPLCEAIIKGKKASKQKGTWFENALKNRDSQGRIHPSINSLQCRTSRMTITGAFPAQTVPKGTSYVRHMLLADEGHNWCCTDYGNMELRGLAAWSGDPTMLKAFHENLDLHDMTATTAFGPMPEGGGHHPMRQYGKGANYTACFGGGWNAVHQQYGVPEKEARKVVSAFWETYPRAKALSKRLMDQARRQGGIYTATGRWIPVDVERPYAALNYFVQGSCRDITAQGILRIEKAGYGDFMRLPVHDEICFSFPKEHALELARETKLLMEYTVNGLLIPADPEIGERSWGDVIDLENSKH
ncbi:DNA polymerase [Streptomyces decoyicus]